MLAHLVAMLGYVGLMLTHVEPKDPKNGKRKKKLENAGYFDGRRPQIVYFLVGICCDQSYMSKRPDCIVVIWELSITDTEPSGRVDSFDIPRRPRLTICRVHGLMQLTAKKLMSTKGPWIYQVAVLCYWDRRCGFPKVSCFNDAK